MRHAAHCDVITPRVEHVQDTVPYGMLGRVGYCSVWDTAPCGIPCRAGYHAGRDTVPGGMPCRAGYHAVRDAMPYGHAFRALRERGISGKRAWYGHGWSHFGPTMVRSKPGLVRGRLHSRVEDAGRAGAVRLLY